MQINTPVGLGLEEADHAVFAAEPAPVARIPPSLCLHRVKCQTEAFGVGVQFAAQYLSQLLAGAVQA